MKKNYILEAMTILEHPDTMEKDAMLWHIAKYHPSVFVWAHRMTSKKGPEGESIDREVLSHVVAGNILAAIKRHRAITPGVGLKESKDYCDGLRDMFQGRV